MEGGIVNREEIIVKSVDGQRPNEALPHFLSNAMRSAWTRRGGDAEQSAEVCCVFLTGVDSRGFSKATDR